MVNVLRSTRFATPVGVVAMCFTALVALSACARRTEVVVVIDSDISYGSGQALAGLLVTVRSDGPDGTLRDRRAIPIGANEHGRFALPASFGVVPLGNDANRTVFIQVDG